MFWNRYLCNRLTVAVGYKDRSFAQRSTLPEVTNASEVLLPTAKHIFAQRPPGVVTHIDIIADQLALAGQHQQSLFTSRPRIDAIKRAVNDKLGRFKVRSGEIRACQCGRVARASCPGGGDAEAGNRNDSPDWGTR